LKKKRNGRPRRPGGPPIPVIPALFVLVSLSFSCAGLSPAAPDIPPQQAAVPEAFVPRWLPFTRGIDYLEAVILDPQLELWALRVDLTDPSLRIVVSGASGSSLPPGSVLSLKTTTFVERYHCAAGINTTPFDPSSAREGEERSITGISVSEGTVVSLPRPPYDALVFYADNGRPSGRPVIVNQADIGDLRSVRNAAGGFYRVLENGEIPEAAKRKTLRASRSAAGLSAGGETLYLLVIDGRRPGSAGATETELGVILRRLGASGGINFDGGGSTALALRYPDGRVRAVNTPIHGGIPGRERGVAACLGIRVPSIP
jgi:hypothetical protein